MDRRWAIVAFGDIHGFGQWCQRAANDPEIRVPFLEMFCALSGTFKLNHEYTIKHLGDGFMVLQELPLRIEGRAMATDFLRNIYQVTADVRTLIKNCPWPRPSGFRSRIVCGYVDKIEIKHSWNPGETCFEYMGYAINLAQKLLAIKPQVPLIIHQSVLEIVGPRPNFAKFTKLKVNERRIGGVDRLDLRSLWDCKF